MNEQLQEALAELLGKANNGIDSAGNFLASELPEVIQQLLMWHGVKSFAFFILSILIIFSLPKIFNYLKNSIPGQPTEDNSSGNWYYERFYCGSSMIGPGGVGFCIGNILGFVAVLVFVLKNINIEWLQIWIAPKVWLIEYAASLTK